MYIRFLIVPVCTAFLLGISCVALADDQSTTDQSSKKAATTGAPASATITEAAPSADELAKQLSNPIAALISVPFQYNYSRTYGDDGYKNLLNIQPVVPISVSKDWNLISRTIIPVIQQKNLQPGRSQFGFGDITQSAWFSPKAPTSSGLVWGVGGAGLIPIGTDDLGADTWAFGPTAIVLKQTGPWTYGFLVNQLWDTGGPADINSMFFQPFLAKALGKGRTISLNAESTYNWNSNEWTVPVNIAYSRVSRWGKQMVSNQIGAGWYVTAPTGDPDWQLRYALTLLFPK